MPSLKGRKQYTGERAYLAEMLFDSEPTPLERALGKVGFKYEVDTRIAREFKMAYRRTVRVPPLMAGLAIYNREGHLVFMLTPNLEAEGRSKKTHPWTLRRFYRDSDLGIDLPAGHSYAEVGEDLTRRIADDTGQRDIGRVVLYRRASRPMRKPHAPTVAEKAKAKPRKKAPAKCRTALAVKRRSR